MFTLQQFDELFSSLAIAVDDNMTVSPPYSQLYELVYDFAPPPTLTFETIQEFVDEYKKLNLEVLLKFID